MVNIHQAKTHLSRLIEEVAAGEEVIIARAGTPLVRLVPVAASHAPRKLGTLKGKVVESSDAWAADPDMEAAFYGGDAEPPRTSRVAERPPGGKSTRAREKK